MGVETLRREGAEGRARGARQGPKCKDEGSGQREAKTPEIQGLVLCCTEQEGEAGVGSG